MEIQFQNKKYGCLQWWAEDIKNEEQTQEIKIPDAMPDIGSVLSAWGQVLVRSKEWRSNGMSINGGVMTWVVYAPEDGSMPRTVEGWIPFSVRLDFPQAQRDGNILAACQLRGVDGRCISARKLMMRANISVMAQALEPADFSVYTPKEVPEDVQLLRRSYPICYPAEAGEKMFQLDEDLTVPSDMAGGKLMSYSIQPEIIDKKLMADKVVFRGSALVRALIRSAEGEMKSCSFEVPFSQYAQLDHEYGSEATAQILPMTTSIELDSLEDGRLRLKAGLTGQYVIYDRPVIEVVEDAYSNQRQVKPNIGTLEVPMVLDIHNETVQVNQTVSTALDEVTDVSLYLQHPILQRGTDDMQLMLSGGFSIVGKNDQGGMTGATAKWESSCVLGADRDARAMSICHPTGNPRGILTSEGVELSGDVYIQTVITAAQGLPLVVGLELGELREPDPHRPGLILCRANDGDLWDLAKRSGSTVDAIRKANRIEDNPLPGQMLLIPVM